MTWMNEYEIDDALRRFSSFEYLGAAARTLDNLRTWVNWNSDGWAFWHPPANAAEKLMELIQKADRFDPVDCTLDEYKVAVRPLKTFRTKANKGDGTWGIRKPGTCDFEIVDPSAPLTPEPPSYPSITIPEEAWASHHDGPAPWDTMAATIRVNGRFFHVNAWRVFVDDAGVQVAYEDDDDLAEIHAALGADGHWETVDILGESYVLIAEPFC